MGLLGVLKLINSITNFTIIKDLLHLFAQTSEGDVKHKGKQVQRTKQGQKGDKTVAQCGGYDLVVTSNSEQLFYKENFQFYAQSGENNPEHVESVTKFFDSSVLHDVSQVEKKALGAMSRLSIVPNPVVLDNFYHRPYVVARYTWPSSAAIRDQVINLDMPEALLTAAPSLVYKMHNIAYWSPDIEIEVQINGTRFHYGRLMFVVRPFANMLSANYVTATNASTWPQWYQIDASSQQSIKFTIPYKHWVRRLSLVNGDPNAHAYANLRAYVTAPLLSAMAATVANVTVTVFARLSNPRYEGYTSTAAAQSADNSELSDLLRRATTAIPDRQVTVTNAPISTALLAGSTVMRDVSVLAQTAGFSVPANPAPTNSMQIRQPLFSKAADMPNSVNLGPSIPTALNTADPSLVNGFKEETTLAHIVSQPSLMDTKKIQSTDVSGTVLWQTPLSPSYMLYDDYDYTPATKTRQPLPAFYIGRLFKLWRGSFKVHLSFIASGFHSLRMRLVWIPTVNVAVGATMSDHAQSNAYNVLMDINKATEYSVVIPYYQNSEWRRVENTTGAATDYLQSTNGVLALVVVNPLTSTMATPQPIYVQIFVSMTDDAQFAAPTLEDIMNDGNPYLADPPAARIQDEDSEEKEVFVAQSMDNMYSETQQCELPSSSAACLRDTKFIDITGGTCYTHRLHGESTSFEITDVKQLSNMLTPVLRLKSAEANTSTGIRLTPFANLGIDYTNEAWYNFTLQIRSIFRFGRGGIRVVGIIDTPGHQGCAYMQPMEGNVTNDIVSASYTNPLIDDTSMNLFTGGYQYFADTYTMPLDVVLPYYSTTPCMPFNFGSQDLVYVKASNVAVSFNTGGVVGITTAFFVATGDDFMFGSLLGMPLLKIK